MALRASGWAKGARHSLRNFRCYTCTSFGEDTTEIGYHAQAAMERLEQHASAGLSGNAVKKATKHVPLLKRATEPALEERLLRFRPAVGADNGQSDHHREPVQAGPML